MRPLQADAADVVWPALFLEKRLLSIWVMSIGLIVEWLVLWLGGFGLQFSDRTRMVVFWAQVVVGCHGIIVAGQTDHPFFVAPTVAENYAFPNASEIECHC
jgi:hypothetical protein